MKKFVYMLVAFLFFSVGANAKTLPNNIQTIIAKSEISKNSISVSVKDVENKKTIYKYNETNLHHPASVQKILTIVPVMEVLGEDYKFVTSIYSRGKQGYLVKLGADPYLKSSDLSNLVGNIDKENITKMYIDDYIIERKDWGEGWQWDDDLNPHILRFNSYNLDNNIANITIMPTEKGKIAQIINQSRYPFVFLNNIVTSEKNDITIYRDNLTAPNTIRLEGSVASPIVKSIPLNNLKRYFDYKLAKNLEYNKIYLKEPFERSMLQTSDKKLAEIEHPVSIAVNDVLLNSNNMVAETMFKLAGGKLYNKQGTDADGIKLFTEYCENNGLDYKGIKIVDASGVSKNNLVSADFITDFLVKNKDNKILEHLATPGQGTLTNRMLPLKNNLRAKTGTLSDISTIAGFITTKKGKKYAFCIMINDPITSPSAKKTVEDYLIREIYFNL